MQAKKVTPGGWASWLWSWCHRVPLRRCVVWDFCLLVLRVTSGVRCRCFWGPSRLQRSRQSRRDEEAWSVCARHQSVYGQGSSPCPAPYPQVVRTDLPSDIQLPLHSRRCVALLHAGTARKNHESALC